MKRLALLVLPALAAACTTVGPDYNRPEIDVPPQFTKRAGVTAASDAALASWWNGFEDPQLSALIERALAQNLDIETAAERIREARAGEVIAGAAAQPRIAAQGSVARQRISENAIPVPPGSGQDAAFGLPGSEFTNWRAGFDARWEIDLLGRTRRSLEAAQARTATAIWNRRDLEVTTAAEVAGAYLTLRRLQAQIDNASAELERQRSLESLVAARTQGGLITGQDLAQQKAERAAAAAAIPILEAQAEAQIHALGVLTGQTPGALTAELAQARPLPSPPSIPAGVPSDLLLRRPDVRAAERALAAASADTGVEVADLYPRFSLTAAPMLISTTLSKLVEWGSRNFSAGAAVDWPLFDGGRRRGRIEAANARQAAALVAYRKAVLVALRDVEDALSRVDGDRLQQTELRFALANATRAAGIARTRYDGGLVTHSEVLLAEARRLSLKRQMIDAEGALARDTAALFKALGGGWPEMEDAGEQP